METGCQEESTKTVARSVVEKIRRSAAKKTVEKLTKECCGEALQPILYITKGFCCRKIF